MTSQEIQYSTSFSPLKSLEREKDMLTDRFKGKNLGVTVSLLERRRGTPPEMFPLCPLLQDSLLPLS